MFQGSVQFRASIESHCLEFGEVFLDGQNEATARIQVQSDETNGISVSVDIENVSTEEDGSRIAHEEVEYVLDALAFERLVPIGPPRMTSQSFSPVAEREGQHTISFTMALNLRCDARAITRVDAATLQDQITNSTLALATHKRMFRQAIRSSGSVERFMHFYNLMLMLYNDRQGDVDQFIRTVEPGVAESPSPKFPNVSETVYTRLRNEFGHTRVGVNVDNTKQKMGQHVGQLLQHVRTAMRRAAQTSP